MKAAVEQALDELEPDAPLREALDPVEGALWARWVGQADAEARAQLAELHMPYARALAAKLYARRHSDEIEFDEYQQLAMVGLMEALDRYAPDRGARFTTFALPRIHGAIFNGLAKLTERQQQVAFRRRMATERIESLSAAMSSADSSQDLFAQLAQVGVGLALGFLLEGTGMVQRADEALPANAYAQLELRQLHRQLWDLLPQLTEREREVMDLHYKQSRPFEEIARHLGLTKGRISQLHQQGVSRLRALFTKAGHCDVAY